MKTYLKAFALVTLSLSLAISTNCFATNDSASSPFTGGTTKHPLDQQTPSMNFGQPFLVEEGDSDPFTSTQSPIPVDNYMEQLTCYPEGQGQPPQNGAGTGTNEAYCVVRATNFNPYTYYYDTTQKNPQLCPTEFTPFFTVEPISSPGGSSGAKGFACPAYAGTYGSDTVGLTDVGTPLYDQKFTPTGHFFMYVSVSALVTLDANKKPILAPGNAFHWKIYCLPNNNTDYLNDFANIDTSCYSKNQSQPASSQVWDSGTLSVSANSSPGTIDTNSGRLCPPAYTPYAQISMGAPDTYTGTSSTDFNVLNSFASCLAQINTKGDHYQLTYLFASSYTEIQKSPGSLTINDPTVDSSSLLNVQWTLYCYPPDNAPPWDYVNNPGGPSNACDTSKDPYK